MNEYDRIARVIRYLDERHARQPGLDELAGIAGLSRSSFDRVFLAWAGITPEDFLQCLTLEYAKALLRRGQDVLAAVRDAGLPGPRRLHDLSGGLEAVSPGDLKRGGAGLTIRIGVAATPFGDALIAETERGVCHLAFMDDRGLGAAVEDVRAAWPEARLTRSDAAATSLASRIFQRSTREGQRPGLRAVVKGTPFQVRVWRALVRVPPGCLVSYGQLAAALGRPSAARSVGRAVGQNPLAYLIPCHRVIRQTGVLGDYRWGRIRKRAMVAWEASPGAASRLEGQAPEATRARGSVTVPLGPWEAKATMTGGGTMGVARARRSRASAIRRLCSLAGWVVSVCLGIAPALGASAPVTLAFAPAVPAPVARAKAARVVVNLKIEEKIGELSKDVQYEFWTYNGRVPGPFIRVREGDTLEVHLDNTSGKVTHTVDFHAVTGPGGGARALMVDPGRVSVATFRMLNPGLYVYHCAAEPIPTHISNGLYGLILVEPAQGLRAVDREYYVMQSEFYTSGETGDTGLQSFSSTKGDAEAPAYVVFNGHTEALVGERALKARAGETVRLFVGNIGPNLVSSFHVIGEIFDRVYREGSVKDFQRDIQTTLIPAGSASIVEFTVEVPGTYVLVDHSIFRTQRGALGLLVVEGPEAPEIYSVKQRGSGAR